VVRGYQAYYAVPGNNRAVNAFRTQAARHWHQVMERRSQKSELPWDRMNRIVTRWLPPDQDPAPVPGGALRRQVTQGKSPVR
jgi:hypothetical protein